MAGKLDNLGESLGRLEQTVADEAAESAQRDAQNTAAVEELKATVEELKAQLAEDALDDAEIKALEARADAAVEAVENIIKPPAPDPEPTPDPEPSPEP